MTERNRSCKFRATYDNSKEAAGKFVTLSMRRVHKVQGTNNDQRCFAFGSRYTG